MSDWQLIESVLQKAGRRQRWLRAWKGFWYGLLVGAIAWLIVHSTFKLAPIPIEVLFYTGLGALVFPVMGFILGGWRQTTPQGVARYIDHKNKLQERISTAYEVASHPKQENWKTLIIADAAKYLSKFDPRQILPHHLPRVSRYALCVLAVAAGLALVPEYRSKANLQEEKDKAQLKEVGKRLAELTRRNLEANTHLMEPTEKAMEAVKELGEQLSKAKLTRSEAMKELASASDKLKDQLKDQQQQNPVLKNLQKSARDSASGNENTGSSTKPSLDKMKAESAADAFDKMKKELEKAKAEMAGMPSKDTAAGQAARDQMSQSLANMAQQAKDMGQTLQSLEEAIAALEANNTEQFVKDLDIATADLEKMKQSAEAMQSLQQQTTKMAKDLASQLEKGQVEAAHETLQKMIEQVKKSGLSEADKKELMKEVSKALDPAGEYGEVARHLKDALKKMDSGENPGAAESMAKAADELKKLLDEMANSDSLKATLASLAKAEQALATKRKWGECSNCGGGQCQGGQCKGGAKKSGAGRSFGQGVGQWGDDNLWVDEVEQEETDNGGIERSDTDARGHSERDQTAIDERFSPDKVKGQLSPGGQMPSVTLKGVSIKGASKVDFEQRASAAQTEAQSALNQDKVPRAYQGSVKEYFNDLKK